MKSLLAIVGAFAAIVFVVFIGTAVAVGGYRLQGDPELEMAAAWTRAFKQEAPELSREIARACAEEIGRSPWTLDGAFALFTCIRREGEEQGYYYSWDEPVAE